MQTNITLITEAKQHLLTDNQSFEYITSYIYIG